jgi:LysM repeat protein
MTTTLTWINPNDTFLTQSQQLNNAQIVAYHFAGTDWTKESISALCGNMAHESSLNPDMHELGYNDSPTRGYGLVQWTPMTKYTDWASAAGLPWDSGDSQLARIDYEVNNNIQWIPDGLQARYGMGDKYNFSFSDFRKNTQGLSVNDLTEAFMWNYEGPSYSAGTNSLPARQSFANLCLSSLDWTGTGGGTTPPPYTSHVQSVASSSQYQYEEKGEIGMYVQVKSGDTLSGIAARYGVNMNGIKQVVFQDILNKDVIGVGEVLLLPNAAAPTPAPQPINVNVNPEYYWVEGGDNLTKIAHQFGTTISQLQAWNNIKNPDLIYAGQRLRVK